MTEGLPGRRQDLQGPPRRLQPDAVPQGRGEGVAAQGVPLLERRRRPDGHPLRAVEGRLPGAAHGDVAQDAGRRLAGPVHQAARSRTSTTCAPIRSSAARRASTTATGWPTGRSSSCPMQAFAAQVARELQGVPAAPEARELQPRRGDAEDVGAARKQVAASVCRRCALVLRLHPTPATPNHAMERTADRCTLHF